jgi:hypothetical protein
MRQLSGCLIYTDEIFATFDETNYVVLRLNIFPIDDSVERWSSELAPLRVL